MARPEPKRERIGDMLVAASLVTASQLAEALAVQRVSGIRIGKQLVELGYVTETQVTQILSNQLSVPWVALDRVEFSTQLLELLPGELADRYTVMPVYVRNVAHQGKTLYIAMDDPTDEDAIRAVATVAGLPVRPMIASPSEIRGVVDARYFGGDEPALEAGPTDGIDSPPRSGVALLDRARPSAPTSPEPTRPARLKPPPPPVRPTHTEGAVPLEHYDVPSRPPETSEKTRTLMLLDGTTIALPLPKRPAVQAHVSEVRHVVKAVRAACADLGVEEAPRWHDLVQAVLDVLAARGVRLSRKEIAEAWTRRRAVAQPRGE